ncbi:MAG: M16 family metallopeptidase, partial [Bdellovibrionota bacterium]
MTKITTGWGWGLAMTIMSTTALADGLLPNGMRSTFFQLDNGLQIYVVENHSAPVFTYQTWFRVGSKDESAKYGETGLAHLFEHMMFRGTKNHADGQFDDLMTRHGGHHQ